MNVVSMPKPARKPQAKSRVSNGNSLGEMDGRSKWARRMRDLIEAYSDDVNEDHSRIPHATRSIIRRAATLTVELERAEVAFAEAGEADPEALRDYQTTTNALRRLIEGLPLKVSVKEAQELEQDMENRRFLKDYLDRLPLTDHAVAIGAKEARLEFLKRVALMVQQAIDGEPMPELLLHIAAELVKHDNPQSADEALL